MAFVKTALCSCTLVTIPITAGRTFIKSHSGYFCEKLPPCLSIFWNRKTRTGSFNEENIAFAVWWINGGVVLTKSSLMKVSASKQACPTFPAHACITDSNYCHRN
jgi:hypothetical protein